MTNKTLLNGLEKNINKLYLIDLFSSTQFQSIVAAVFLLSKGFNLTQLFLFGSIYAIGSMISEIPTGAYSDRIGRKKSLILNTIIQIPTLLVVILSDSFSLIMVMYFLFGVSASFSSGTDSAILYDSLKGLGREIEFKKVNGKLKWLGSWGGAIGGIIGGLIAKHNLAYAWWAWFIMLFVILITKATLVEPPKYEESNTRSYLFHIKQSIAQSFRGEASYFILYYVFIWLFFWLGYSFWQPYLQLTQLPIEYFGFFYAGISLVSGLSSKQAHKLEERLGMRLSLFVIPILLSMAFFFEARYIFVFSFLFIAIQALSSGYFSPVLEDYVNTRIPSHSRATILSVKNMLSNIIFMAISPIIGYFADLYSLATVLYLMASLLIALAFIFFFVYKTQAQSLMSKTPEKVIS